MAFTAGLTGGLTEPITKTLLEDYFYGKLTLEQMVAALGSTIWLDATSGYPLNSISPDTPALDTETIVRWLDRSGNDNHGNQAVIINMPIWSENQLNTTEDVVSFNGGTSAQWLDLPTNTGYMDGVTDKPYTWCFLFKQDSLASNNFLLGESTNPYSWYWYINSGGSVIVRSFDKSVNAYKSFSTTIASLNWVFFAVSYSASNGFTAYINGVDKSVTTSTVGSYVAMEDLPVRLGNYAGSASNTFRGKMGQTMYFQKELTQDEVTLIKDYYNEKYGLSL